MLDYSDPTEVMFRIQRRGVTNHPNTGSLELSNAVGTQIQPFLMPDYILAGSQAWTVDPRVGTAFKLRLPPYSVQEH